MTRSLFGPDDEWTLAELKEWLNTQLAEGLHCPCCGQYAKVYRRKINSGMAQALIRCFKLGRGDYVHVNHLGSHEVAQLQWWRLIEEQPGQRPDGGRTGWWRVTRLGEDWMRERLRVPKYVQVYDGQLLGAPFGDDVSIRDAVGTKFDLAHLMAGV